MSRALYYDHVERGSDALYCIIFPPRLSSSASSGSVSQVINVTNSMQGTKSLMMKIKIQFRRGVTPVAEVAQVAQFPASY